MHIFAVLKKLAKLSNTDMLINGEIDCQIAEGEPKYSTTPEVDENEEWTVYTIMKLGLVRG